MNWKQISSKLSQFSFKAYVEQEDFGLDAFFYNEICYTPGVTNVYTNSKGEVIWNEVKEYGNG